MEALIKAGAKVNARMTSHWDLMLRNEDAWVDVGENDEDTPLHLAARNGYHEIVKALVRAGADRQMRTKQRTPTKNEKTAMELARDGIARLGGKDLDNPGEVKGLEAVIEFLEECAGKE